MIFAAMNATGRAFSPVIRADVERVIDRLAWDAVRSQHVPDVAELARLTQRAEDSREEIAHPGDLSAAEQHESQAQSATLRSQLDQIHGSRS